MCIRDSPRDIIKSAQIKKGSKAGNTEYAHRAIPRFAESRTTAGKNTIETAIVEVMIPAYIYFTG